MANPSKVYIKPNKKVSAMSKDEKIAFADRLFDALSAQRNAVEKRPR